MRMHGEAERGERKTTRRTKASPNLAFCFLYISFHFVLLLGHRFTPAPPLPPLNLPNNARHFSFILTPNPSNPFPPSSFSPSPRRRPFRTTTLSMDPKKNARSVLQSVMTLKGMEKSGRGTSINNPSVVNRAVDAVAAVGPWWCPGGKGEEDRPMTAGGTSSPLLGLGGKSSKCRNLCFVCVVGGWLGMRLYGQQGAADSRTGQFQIPSICIHTDTNPEPKNNNAPRPEG